MLSFGMNSGSASVLFLTLSAWLSVLPAWATSVEEVSNPRDTNTWVSDESNVIDAGTEAQINAAIQKAEQEFGVEIAVVTVDDVDTATPKDFATKLFNHWGIGKNENNSGLLVLLVKNARRLEMETGYGLESVLSDGWLKSMQGRAMVPEFKKGRFGVGIRRGVEESITRLRDNRDGIVTSIENPKEPDGPPSKLPWLALFGAVGAAGVGGGRAYRRRKKTRCPTCAGTLVMLSEEEDDDKLTDAQLTEEIVGSVDYQYWFCEEDGYTRLDRIDKWFSGYSKCKSCEARTLQVTTTNIVAATEYTRGVARVTTECHHCDYNHVSERSTPRITRSSGGGFSTSSGGSWSSGSSGGSSFGGGSSGGGGSGSSW